MEFHWGSGRKVNADARVQRGALTVTNALIAINVLVFVAMVVRGVSFTEPTPSQVIPWGADFGPLTVGAGQWWRMLTACFIHFGVIHIGMNMFVLYQIGPFIETVFGRTRYLLIYFFAGLAASIASLLIHPLTTSAGASGAIFGLYGAVFGFLLMERRSLASEAFKSIGQSAGLFVVYNFIYGGMNGRTDISAHLGGLVAGFFAGLLLVPRRANGPWRVPLAGSVLVLFAILGAGVVTAAGRPENHDAEGAFMTTLVTSQAMDFGNEGQLLYRDGITESEAKKLADALAGSQLAQVKGALVVFSKGAGKTSISIPLSGRDTAAENGGAEKALWNDPDVVQEFTDLGRQIAPAVGSAYDLVLLDGDGAPKRTIAVDGPHAL